MQDNDIERAVHTLAALLKESSEYQTLCSARERVFADDAKKALLDEYRKLRLRVQAGVLTGETDDETLLRLTKLGELLQLDPVTSDYLFKELRLRTMLGDIYKELADAVGDDLSLLD